MKIAIITGSSKGIGFAITQYLLNQQYVVHGLSRSHPKDLTSHPNYHGISIDLKDTQAVIKTAEHLKKQHPEIHLFVNCAGYGMFHELEQFSDQAILDLLQVNLLSPILICRHLLPALKKQQGKLIFIGSEADHTPHKKGTLYCAAKFGLRGFVKSLRLECLRREVAVTLICPGLVDSTFYEKLEFEPGEASGNAIQIVQIVDTFSMILDMNNNVCVEEIHIAPMKHVVKKK